MLYTWPELTDYRSLSYSHILALPLVNSVVPIAVPTLYLWLVDTLALQRGTWVINPGTKTGLFVWPNLEIEYVFAF
jgi:15-cis-phytoene synthase/lycopene beta-cyclase